MDPLPFRFLQAQLKQRRRRHDQDGPARATTTRPQPPGGNRAPRAGQQCAGVGGKSTCVCECRYKYSIAQCRECLAGPPTSLSAVTTDQCHQNQPEEQSLHTMGDAGNNGASTGTILFISVFSYIRSDILNDATQTSCAYRR